MKLDQLMQLVRNAAQTGDMSPLEAALSKALQNSDRYEAMREVAVNDKFEQYGADELRDQPAPDELTHETFDQMMDKVVALHERYKTEQH